MDSRQFTYFNRKVLQLAMAKKNPRKVAWTTVYRKLHKKDSNSDAEKKKRSRRTQKAQRAIVGVSLEAIRTKKPQTTSHTHTPLNLFLLHAPTSFKLFTKSVILSSNPLNSIPKTSFDLLLSKLYTPPSG